MCIKLGLRRNCQTSWYLCSKLNFSCATLRFERAKKTAFHHRWSSRQIKASRTSHLIFELRAKRSPFENLPLLLRLMDGRNETSGKQVLRFREVGLTADE